MAQPQNKKGAKPKTTKENKKEIEDKTFGMKNKKKCRDVKKQYDKIETQNIINKKNRPVEERIILVQPKAPLGVDPKTIPCVYFINKLCTKGDKCKFGHGAKKVEVGEKKENVDVESSKLVCRFLIDAMNDGALTESWSCPDPSCRDIHKINEVNDAQISLEEFIELKRMDPEESEMVTEAVFFKWKEDKIKEEKLHIQKLKDIKEGKTGSALFKESSHLFVDDDEVEDIDYKAREEEADDDELTEKLSGIEIK